MFSFSTRKTGPSILISAPFPGWRESTFKEALSFIQEIGIPRISEWEQSLTTYLRTKLAQIPEIKLIGNTSPRGPLQSFSFLKHHPLDVATLLDLRGIAVRSGHMCCQPLVRSLGASSIMRVSFALYNTFSECDQFLSALEDVLRLL